MKLLTVRFEEAVDIAALAVGKPVTITDGTVSPAGIVMAVTQLEEPPEPALVPHTHPAAIGPAVAE
jgi:hypothetical protein